MQTDLFTADEVKRAKDILATATAPHTRIRDEIITDDVMQRIDQQTGQKNDPLYMAYRLEYVASETV